MTDEVLSGRQLQLLIDTMRAEAIAFKLAPDAASTWRSLCRTYSKTFHTPLHVVENLPPQDVILAIFESQLDDVDVEEHIEKLMQHIYRIEDPAYDEAMENELQDFIKQAEEEEEARIAMKRPVHPDIEPNPLDVTASEKTVLEKEVPLPENLPKQGYLDLSYLDDSENER